MLGTLVAVIVHELLVGRKQVAYNEILKKLRNRCTYFYYLFLQETRSLTYQMIQIHCVPKNEIRIIAEIPRDASCH